MFARAFAVECLGMLPSESDDPVFDPAHYRETYAKFALPGARRVVPPEFLRDYSKTGQAYGFTVENADQAHAWHDAGVANGGTAIEDPPGVRDGGKVKLYLAYLRDPDGNKICAMKRM